jgi:drug/metabolite transporter (DMT)-like permease
MTGWRVAGILLAAAGMGIIVSHGDLAALVSGRAWTVGDGLVLVSALNWAVFTVLSKRLIDDRVAGPGERDRSLVLTFYILVFGLLFCVPWLALEGRWAGIHGLSPQGWGALAFLGVACSGLAYIFWFAGLEAVDATQVGAFLYLEPLVTSIVAAPVLGERITISLALGGATILFGLWMVNRT